MDIVPFVIGVFVGGCLFFAFCFWLIADDYKRRAYAKQERGRDHPPTEEDAPMDPNQIQPAVEELKGLAGQIRDAADDPASVRQLADQLEQRVGSLSDADNPDDPTGGVSNAPGETPEQPPQ